MNQSLQMTDLVTTMGPAQDVTKAMPSPEVVGKFQALMQQASPAEPTAGPNDAVTALSRIVGARDVQMEQLYNDVDAKQLYESRSPLQNMVMQTNLIMDRMDKVAQLQVDTTITASFMTSTKGSVESLMKNQ